MSTLTPEGNRILNEESLNQLFKQARTSSAWLDKAVSKELIQELYDLVKLGPTSANLGPGRFVFVTSPEAKERLLPTVAPGNLEKTKTAPVTVIVAYDSEFYEKAGELFPLADVKPWFEGKPEGIKAHGEQNGNLQAAYLIIAARALGLAAGPMGGFDREAVDKEFFPDGKWRTLLLINLGYPDPTAGFPRLPRLSFDDAALIL
jgi:3-hydroxypropanoate dehydrogenase